jgi:hypothetical protein
MVESTRLQYERTILFIDPNTQCPSLRNWIMKKQREILVRVDIDMAESSEDMTPSS